MKTLYNPLVKAVIGTLKPEDRQAVQNLLALIKLAPHDGCPVEYLPGFSYQKTYDANNRRWPKGIRVVYRLWADCFQVEALIIEDLGDHRTCARYPGYSIYPDER